MSKTRIDDLPQGWQAVLAAGDTPKCLELLPQIEMVPSDESLPFLFELLNTEDFSLKFRTLLTIQRLARPQSCPGLCDYIKKEPLTHWRIAALDAVASCPDPKRPQLMADFLKDDDPIFLRGAVWAYGCFKEPALPYLAEFCGKPYAPKVRGEVLAEALYLAAGGRFSRLEAFFPQYPELRRFWDNRLLPKEPLPKFQVFPYPDYLWDKAKQAGISKRDFQQLRFWHRKGRQIL